MEKYIKKDKELRFQIKKAEQIDRLFKKIYEEVKYKKISLDRLKQLDKRIEFLNLKSNQL
jgi:hypothetical protein